MTMNPPNLAPMLGIARPYKRRSGKLHDVGNGRMLTVRQIALESRNEPPTIYARIDRGETGPMLLRPRRSKLFDCGKGEMLTIGQIVARTGLSESSVRNRISRGAKGRQILKSGRKDLAAPRSSTMLLAALIADAYPDQLPTTKQIRALRPMSEATAERWLAAFRAARAKL